jgi:small basic protein (TIGR04137 family)
MNIAKAKTSPDRARKRAVETRNAGSRRSASLPTFSRLGVDFFRLQGSVRPSSSGEYLMSQHQSLKGASTITAKRNVLKRFERVELLKKRGVFKPGDKVFGLPKTKPDA